VIRETWVAWYEPWDMLHTCSPVVLRFDEEQLELWAVSYTDFQATWDSVDLTTPLFDECRWVADTPEALQKAVGAKITKINFMMIGGGYWNGVHIEHTNGSFKAYNSDEMMVDDGSST
jgi:hypothetical protein